ncbi:DEAD/DEAH box helicase family protein, partial [Corynebacterium diphtheriae]
STNGADIAERFSVGKRAKGLNVVFSTYQSLPAGLDLIKQTAIEKTLQGFATHDRGKLIMACGTGKTFTSLRLAEKVAENNGGKARILFLVPSISLLSQTLREWTAQAGVDLRSFAVCSDSKVSKKKTEDISSYDLEVPVSTNGADIAERFSVGKRAKGLNVVFSTYQSLPA